MRSFWITFDYYEDCSGTVVVMSRIWLHCWTQWLSLLIIIYSAFNTDTRNTQPSVLYQFTSHAFQDVFEVQTTKGCRAQRSEQINVTRHSTQVDWKEIVRFVCHRSPGLPPPSPATLLNSGEGKTISGSSRNLISNVQINWTTKTRDTELF